MSHDIHVHRSHAALPTCQKWSILSTPTQVHSLCDSFTTMQQCLLTILNLFPFLLLVLCLSVLHEKFSKLYLHKHYKLQLDWNLSTRTFRLRFVPNSNFLQFQSDETQIILLDSCNESLNRWVNVINSAHLVHPKRASHLLTWFIWPTEEALSPLGSPFQVTTSCRWCGRKQTVQTRWTAEKCWCSRPWSSLCNGW